MATEEPQRRLGEIENGVSVEDHLAFIEWVAKNPDDAMLSFRATGETEAAVNRTTATIGEYGLGGEEMGESREHTLEFGLPVELEEAMAYVEPTDRYEAIEGALAGLTACINGTIQYNALREGIPVESITTRVRVPTDLRMLFGVHDTDRADEMFGEPEIEVEVTGSDLSDEDVTKIEGYPKRSPVYTLVTLAHENNPDVTVTSE
ncbi:hypothetical protein [Haloarcula onubensis]|uniref:OsmC family protein n=1 Tax=Haloarcula onubensis TaxID=2950539 RepID=A0ABU2FQ04_9EURY|nr:hypothetical protein [Halomicroarcula sp. S3CR25-11]MDS0282356.1 OsmC family protein [Halomicroarcula sp. S3CR25-11]